MVAETYKDELFLSSIDKMLHSGQGTIEVSNLEDEPRTFSFSFSEDPDDETENGN